MTDQQLQLALVKMLPEKIKTEIHYGYTGSTRFYWNDETENGTDILNTEWLHVCWLVEQTLSWRAIENAKCEAERYLDELKDSGGVPGCFAHYCSSWQQRALALCKVKGITP